MKTITMQFVGGDSILSHAIELKGSGPYSHVDIVMPPPYAESEMLFGSQADEIDRVPAGVWPRRPNYEVFDSVARIEIVVTDEEEEKFWDFLLAQQGKPYDNTAIAAFIVGRDWQDADAWFCSELVMAAICAAGVFVQHPLMVPCNKIDPNTAFAILSTWGTVSILKTDPKLAPPK